MILNSTIERLGRLSFVPFKFKLKLLLFFLKQLLGLGNDDNLKDLNAAITTLLRPYKGFLVTLDINYLTADFNSKLNVKHRVTLRKPPSTDYAVYKQVFGIKEYESLIKLIFNNLINDSYDSSISNTVINVVDAGGNIGAFTLYIKGFFPFSRCVVIEPDRSNLEILEKNINQNQLLNTTVIEGGIWSEDTYLNTIRDRNSEDWAVQVVKSETPTTVKGYSINTIMQMVNFDIVDILKIDIEGSEKGLFEDYQVASAFLSKTKFLAIEIHHQCDCRSNVINCLKQNGFDFFDINETTFGVNRNLVVIT